MRRIVEEKVATPAERRIHEVSSGILCFSRRALLAHLERLSADNPQKEYLLTDLVGILSRQRERIECPKTASFRQIRVCSCPIPEEETMKTPSRGDATATAKDARRVRAR